MVARNFPGLCDLLAEDAAGLRTCPHLASFGVVLLLIRPQQLGQPKVCDLDVLWRLHQDVPGGQVPVHQAPVLQVVHALKKGPRCETPTLGAQTRFRLRGEALWASPRASGAAGARLCPSLGGHSHWYLVDESNCLRDGEKADRAGHSQLLLCSLFSIQLLEFQTQMGHVKEDKRSAIS